MKNGIEKSHLYHISYEFSKMIIMLICQKIKRVNEINSEKYLMMLQRRKQGLSSYEEMLHL